MPGLKREIKDIVNRDFCCVSKDLVPIKGSPTSDAGVLQFVVCRYCGAEWEMTPADNGTWRYTLVK